MTISSVVAMAIASKGQILHEMDVKNAFFHGGLEEEKYLESSLLNFGESYPSDD